MPLSADEAATFAYLEQKLGASWVKDSAYDAYYEGTQRLVRLGLAVPPELSRFETVVNWPRLVVDSLEERCDVKAFVRPGTDTEDDALREGWESNNLDSEFHLTLTDSFVFGRGFVSVGANEDDPDHPLILVESPRETAVDVDPRHRRVRSALKMYGVDDTGEFAGLARHATLMLPDVTIWLERSRSSPAGWVEVDRDEHKLDRVAMFPFFNRRRTGKWVGVSEMADAISMTDAAARALTNLQVAQETHAVPQRYALGVSKGDFVDSSGVALPVWQAYFGAIWANQNKDAKVGQFSASDLRNFHETVNHYAGLVAGLYGLPMRYFGLNTANPPSADGIRADEARHVKRAERKMSYAGDQLGRVMATYERIRTGEWPSSGDRISVLWHDAATPTYAAKVDGIQKLTGGKAILSRRGGWDELGWSEARKDREARNLEDEASDPVLDRLTREVVEDAAPSVG